MVLGKFWRFRSVTDWHSLCEGDTIPKASKLSEFECGRIVEQRKQGLLQLAIEAEVHHSKTVICNFPKDPESLWNNKI